MQCGGVVRSAAPQIGHVARGAVRGDEARHYRHAGAVGQTLPDELFGQIRFGDVLSEVGLRADELPRVVEPRAFEHGGHDSRREAFAVADDRVARAGREVADQVDAAQDIGQFVEQFVRPPADRAAPLGRHRFVDRRAVAGHDFGQRVGVVGLSGRGCGRRGQQTVGDAAQRRNDHDDLAVVGGDDPAHLSQTLCGTYRRSAEFQYFHLFRCFTAGAVVNTRSYPSRRHSSRAVRWTPCTARPDGSSRLRNDSSHASASAVLHATEGTDGTHCAAVCEGKHSSKIVR